MLLGDGALRDKDKIAEEAVSQHTSRYLGYDIVPTGFTVFTSLHQEKMQNKRRWAVLSSSAPYCLFCVLIHPLLTSEYPHTPQIAV
jgi:hypothetical protein